MADSKSSSKEPKVTGRVVINPDGTDITDSYDQTKIVEDGGYTYVCKSKPGTAEATAEWKIYRIDSNGSKVYADGNYNYDNVATDPTTLNYSYS